MCYYQPVPQNSTTFSWNYSKGDYEAFNVYFQQLDRSEFLMMNLVLIYATVDYDCYKVCRYKAKDVMCQARLNYKS